jgi:hypothetical protein
MQPRKYGLDKFKTINANEVILKNKKFKNKYFLEFGRKKYKYF